MDEQAAEIREAALEDQAFLADPGAPVEPRVVATAHLTREMLEAAFARLEHHELRVDPVRAHAEQLLTRYLDEQPPGTAESLLQQMYGGVQEEQR